MVLQASRGAVFQLASADRYLALPTPAGRPIFGITPEHLAVLAAFVAPATPEEICALLQPEFPGLNVSDIVDDLLAWNLLVVHQAPRGASGGFGHIESHIPMLADTKRVLGYARAIQAHAPGKTVAELGCGTGILSLVAARAGAQFVWTVEESDIADVAAGVFRANRVRDRVHLVRANSFDVEPPEPVDLLIHELFGVDPFEEGVISSITDARRRWLKPSGRLLPCAFTVMACAVGGKRWRTGEARLETIRKMAKELQVDLSPVLKAGRGGPTRRLDASEMQPTPDEVLTKPVELLHVDLTVEADFEDRSYHTLVSTGSGELGAIIVWFDIHLDETRTLSTSPFEAATHWGWQIWDLPDPIPVGAGKRAHMEVVIETFEGCPQLDITAVHAD